MRIQMGIMEGEGEPADRRWNFLLWVRSLVVVNEVEKWKAKIFLGERSQIARKGQPVGTPKRKSGSTPAKAFKYLPA